MVGPLSISTDPDTGLTWSQKFFPSSLPCSSCWLPLPAHRTMKPRRSLSSWHFITARNKALDGPWFKRKENRHDQSILSMILKVENLVDSWWGISIGPLSCSDRLDKWHDWYGISMHYWNSTVLFRSTGHRGKYLQGRLVQGAGLPLRSAWLQRWDRWLAGRNSSTRTFQQAQQCIQTDFLFVNLICSIIIQYTFWCTMSVHLIERNI